jgi:putative transposase
MRRHRRSLPCGPIVGRRDPRRVTGALVSSAGPTMARGMSRSGNVWDNAAMESFFSSLKTERAKRKTYRTRDEAKADVFDYIERFYNPKRRHSTLGYLSPMEFEMRAQLA